MKKIVVIEPGYRDYREELAILQEYAPLLTVVKLGTPREEIWRAVAEAEAILVREAPVDRALLDHAPRCRAVVRYGVGVDNIDLAYARERGVRVANVPDYGSDDVAEHAMALMFAAARRIVTRDRDVRAGRWGIGQSEPMPRLCGKTLGVLGFGRIAKCFVTKARGLGFAAICVTDPLLDEKAQREWGVTAVPLAELCARADVLSVHVPLLPQTRHMIGPKELGMMKSTAILVNAGRGGVVDEDALADALGSGRLFAAGIDTFEQEPVPTNHRLLALPNTVVSDHTAWYTVESVIDLQRKAAQEVRRVFAGEEPLHWVNR